MDLQARLDELLRVAGEMGLMIQRVPLGGDGGGFCIVKGQKRLFVDLQADVETRYEHTLAALSSLEEIDTHFLLPEVREDIEAQRAQG
jgi:hypothetical protein